MYPMPVARSRPLIFNKLAQVVFLGIAAAVQLSSCQTSTTAAASTISTSTSTTSTSTISTSTSTTSASTTSASTTSASTTLTSTTSTTNTGGSTSVAWTATETGPPTPANILLDTSLAATPDWCPTYHGAYWTPMAPDGSGNLHPFVVGNDVLSFAILCGVNIPALPAINPYVFDFSVYPEPSFDNCLQSCAQYNQRQAYEAKLTTFAQMCTAVTWDLQGRCYLKAGVTAFPGPQNGPGGAISAILQFPVITAVGANVNQNYFIGQTSGVNTSSSEFWVSLQWTLCGGKIC